MGDLAVLLNGGMSRGRAFLLNVLASLASVLGGVVAFFWFEQAGNLLPYALAVAAASFVYVAVADLIPGLHRRVDFLASITQFVLIGSGIAVIFLTHSTMH